MKKTTLAVLALALASFAPAQVTAPLTFQILFDGTDSALRDGSAAGTITAAEYDGIAVTPDGNTIYVFDSIGSGPAANRDSVYRGVAPFAGANFTTFISEAQLADTATLPSASATDMTADATNLYVTTFDSVGINVWRVPHAGSFNATTSRMIDETNPDILTSGLNQCAVDAKNGRLVVTFNDVFVASGGYDERIAHLPLSASAQTTALTTLVGETAIETLLATLAGYGGTPGTAGVDRTNTDDLNIVDHTVQADGDVIFSHGFQTDPANLRQVDGTLFRVTETGTLSIFISADQLITLAGADPANVNIGNVSLATMPNGSDILVLVAHTSNNTVLQPFVGVLAGDASSLRIVATRDQMLGALTSGEQTGLLGAPADGDLFGQGSGTAAFDGKHTMAIDAAGDIYIYRQRSGSNLTRNAVLKLSGVVASNVGDWSLYN